MDQFSKDLFLFQANKTLLEENEDLNAQLLARAIHEGQHMLAEGSSLADELDHLTKEEVTLTFKEPIMTAPCNILVI